MKNKILMSLMLGIFLISLVSANGLSIIPTSFDVNRTVGVEKFITFNITNEEPFDFFDIEFEDNPHISMTPIDLVSGESKEVTAEITGTQDFSGVITLKGFYESDLGEQNELHEVEVDYDTGFSQCDFSIVQGDSVEWNNTVVSQIKLINLNTGNEIATIQQGETYTELFDEVVNFEYYATRYGIKFTNDCQISVLGTEGLINNPEYDTTLALDLKVNFEPTNISVTILEDTYNVAPGSSVQDLLSIKNTGNLVAKDINLKNDWFVFSANNFDLEPGESRNVGYTISPLINNTNQTNQSYVKELKITGNFDTFTKEFHIFVPHTIIDEDFFKDTRTLRELFEERLSFILAYCNDNPNTEECTNLFNRFTSGQDGNETDDNLELFKAIIDDMDKDKEFRDFVLKKFGNLTSKLDETQNKTTITLNEVQEGNEKVKDYQSGVNFAAGSFVLLLLSIGGYFIFKKWNEKKKKEEFENYY